ncbi:MAG: hypothetical protein O7A03_02625, partial [Alphaproteobacteria bacterium]|nr:hypothetical protein [Alphaproteobacteria bacterium]
TMYGSGFRALYDFFTAMPSIMIKHHKVDNFYKEHRKFNDTETLFEKRSTKTDLESSETSRHAAE